MNRACVITMLLSLCACEMQMDVNIKNPDAITQCKDIRNGETFSFAAKTVRNARISLDDTCFDATDEQGKNRTICTSQQSFIKCQ